MKTPRDLSGQELLKLLKKHFGYEQTRQVGSHIRATTEENGVHHITIPNHDPLKVGTLNAIIGDVAEHFGISKDDVFKALF
jgi:predicted RNA binding protein YcfA (HicA-like mRNA interferase family)